MSSCAEALVDTLCEFIEVLVHAVLCATEAYPKEAFGPRHVYNTQTQWCRHPKVQQHIGGVVHKLKPLVKAGHLTQLAVAFLTPDARIAKRLLLRVDCFQLNPDTSEVDWSALAGHFTSALTKIHFIDNLSNIEPGSGWELQVQCQSRHDVDMTFWEEIQGLKPQQATTNQHRQLQPTLPTVEAVKSINIFGLLQLQVLLETSSA